MTGIYLVGPRLSGPSVASLAVESETFRAQSSRVLGARRVVMLLDPAAWVSQLSCKEVRTRLRPLNDHLGT